MINKESVLLSILKNEIIPATGCTEPIAIAYAVSVAKKKAKGILELIDIRVDPNIYKNGLRAIVPSTKLRGLKIAAALGYINGDSEKKYRVIEDISKKDVENAEYLIKKNKINIEIKKETKRLYIEVVLITNKDKVRVIAIDSHLNIIKIEKIGKFDFFEPFSFKKDENDSPMEVIHRYNFDDFLDFAKDIDINEIGFLEEGIEMNLKIAKEGLNLKSGIGKKLNDMIEEGILCNNMVNRTKVLCSAAVEARMSGVKLPVMISAGSGNHGITIFLSNFAVFEKKQISKERLLRSLALSNLITLFIKSHTGRLSAMCGCGIAAGVGASAGIAYLLGGGKDEIYGSLLNMVGSISGIICDGGKEGCAYKISFISGCIVESALLSMRGAIINYRDGILSSDFIELFKNLGFICNPGIVSTDKAILEVLLSSKD